MILEDNPFVFEKDEYFGLVEELKVSAIIQTHRVNLLWKYNNSFTGKDFLEWIKIKKEISK